MNRRTFSQGRLDSLYWKELTVESKIIVERIDLGITRGNINSNDKEEIFCFPDWKKIIIYHRKRKPGSD